MERDQFEEVAREAILSLPQDMKAMLRVVEDPDLGQLCFLCDVRERFSTSSPPRTPSRVCEARSRTSTT